MIHKETQVRQLSERVAVAVTCDLCKCRFEFKHARPVEDRVNWSAEPITPQETIVEYRQVLNSAWISTITAQIAFHICPDCFIKRLVPWMQEQGAEPNLKGQQCEST